MLRQNVGMAFSTDNQNIGLRHQVLKIIQRSRRIRIYGIFLLKDKTGIATTLRRIAVGTYQKHKKYKIHKILGFVLKFLKNIEILFYYVDIPFEDILQLDMHNGIYLTATEEFTSDKKMKVLGASSQTRFSIQLKSEATNRSDGQTELEIVNRSGRQTESEAASQSGEGTKLEVINQDGKKSYWRSMPYTFLPRSFLFHGPITPLQLDGGVNQSIFVRQGRNDIMWITVRDTNRTDFFSEKIKVALAFIVAKLFCFRHTILLYEKNCEGYEESAAVLYEKLLDLGYKNAYFILDKKSEEKYDIKQKYKQNIITKYSFKHYVHFFQASVFLATETLYHAVELRTLNRFIHFHIKFGKYQYVWLQHGVMYMVSIDVKTRRAFRYGTDLRKGTKIVVSSKLEAQHFIEKGGFPKDSLYVTGLPKFDRSIQNPDANKIVVMTTWRPWEINLVETDPIATTYYKMIKRIVQTIPEQYAKQLIVLPHPLIADAMSKTDLSKYLPTDIKQVSYNVILKQCKVLITDYSSIAYDAFYRGANIIFYWEEKGECMDKYEAVLMLNEDNAPGDIVYSPNQLEYVLEQNYKAKGQKLEYKKRYKKIVEFDDNRNTERLITFLKKDGII